MKTSILFKETYFRAPLKCGTRSLRAYIGLAADKDLLLNYKDNPWVATQKSRQFTYNAVVPYDYDIEGSNNYNKIYNEKLYFKDFNKFEDTNADLKTKILIIRDPITRFVSAFSMMRKNLYLEKELTMQKFIETFDQLMWEYGYHRSHFKPMTYAIGLDPNWYTHIYTLEQMSEVKKHIEQLCGYELPTIHINKGRDTEEIVNSLTEEQIDWIKQKYIIDYRVYGKFFI